MSINPFSEIPIPHLAIMVSAMQQVNSATTKEQMLDDLELLNNLLTIQRTHRLLLRKRGLRNMLEATIDNHVRPSGQNLNTRPR